MKTIHFSQCRESQAKTQAKFFILNYHPGHFGAGSQPGRHAKLQYKHNPAGIPRDTEYVHPELIGSLKLGYVWVFVHLIHRQMRINNQLYNNPNIVEFETSYQLCLHHVYRDLQCEPSTQSHAFMEVTFAKIFLLEQYLPYWPTSQRNCLTKHASKPCDQEDGSGCRSFSF